MESRVYFVLIFLVLHIDFSLLIRFMEGNCKWSRSSDMRERLQKKLILSQMQWTAEEKKSMRVRKSAENNKHYTPGNYDTKRLVARDRELRKKPSGHLTPLRPDDMDNDGVVSVAVGPPPIRPKFDKSKVVRNKNSVKNNNNNTTASKASNINTVHFVKDILTQLGQEFLSHQVNEDFVFGQYVGNAMKNITRALKLKMQHDILDIIVKYQKLNNGEITKEDIKSKGEDKNIGPQYAKTERNSTIVNNETEEPWPDFSNLAKIVG